MGVCVAVPVTVGVAVDENVGVCVGVKEGVGVGGIGVGGSGSVPPSSVTCTVREEGLPTVYTSLKTGLISTRMALGTFKLSGTV